MVAEASAAAAAVAALRPQPAATTGTLVRSGGRRRRMESNVEMSKAIDAPEPEKKKGGLDGEMERKKQGGWGKDDSKHSGHGTIFDGDRGFDFFRGDGVVVCGGTEGARQGHRDGGEGGGGGGC